MASGDKFYLADKETLDEVDEKIGSTKDTGGSSTAGSVFGKINYLVSQVSSYLSNIYIRLGTPTDSANDATSGNVHAKLNWFLNLFGKTNDTGGSVTTGTIMAKENAILAEASKSSGDIAKILDYIGQPADLFGDIQSGSLNGKVNAVLSNLLGGAKSFVADGSLTIPAGVYKIKVTACAGGGGGGGKLTYKENNAQRPYYEHEISGAGGSGGCSVYNKEFTVTPGQVIDITVGKGGIGGIATETTSTSAKSTGGSNGTATILSGIVTLAGGHGGKGAGYSDIPTSNTDLMGRRTPSAGTGSGVGGSGGYKKGIYNSGSSWSLVSTCSGYSASAGSYGTAGKNSGYDGDGGGGSYGNGGSLSTIPQKGGGGAGNGSTTPNPSYCNGADGYVLITWGA